MNKLMNKLMCSTLAMAMLTAPGFVYGSGQKELSLVIFGPGAPVQIGQPIPIRVELKNISDHEIKAGRVVGQRQAELNYQITLLDANGHAVPQTTYGAAASKGQVLIVSRVVLPLKPGQTLTQRTDLTKLFKITEPGTYTVRVGRKWPETKAGKMEWSNTLTLTITD